LGGQSGQDGQRRLHVGSIADGILGLLLYREMAYEAGRMRVALTSIYMPLSSKSPLPCHSRMVLLRADGDNQACPRRLTDPWRRGWIY
jgi:hypothetical protein